MSAINTKKTVFLTGASGGMGQAAMNEILTRSDHLRLRILVRPSQKNKELMKEYESNPALEIVWGDMRNYNDIYRCVGGADYVLHVGAFVSPAADNDPQQCIDINYGSTRHIIRAVKEQDNADQIGVVYIGTIAETGCRMPPIHWGRCGDPIKGSVFDYYAVSKIASERAVIESGLKKWVSLRQTGILPTKSSTDPIMFHQPLDNVLEWVTAYESGILMANVCEDEVPDSFWRKIYNISGDSSFRLTCAQFFNDMYKPLGLSVRDVFCPQWFASFNFHGQWYTDADDLNDILQFRRLTYQQYIATAHKEMAAAFSGAKDLQIPTAAQQLAGNEAIARMSRGPLWMVENNLTDWLDAFYGGPQAALARSKNWDDYDLSIPDMTPTYLDHGYDESKDFEKLDISDLKAAAEYRGGICLATTTGSIYEPLTWKCAFGHEFEASPNLVLKGGHWCPECERKAWNYGETAKRSRFFNQVWAPLHSAAENSVVIKTVNDQSVQLDQQ